MVGVRAVTFEAFVRENGSDVEVEADLVVVVVEGAVVMQVGGKDEDACDDQGRYGGNAADGSRFSLKIN